MKNPIIFRFVFDRWRQIMHFLIEKSSHPDVLALLECKLRPQSRPVSETILPSAMREKLDQVYLPLLGTTYHRNNESTTYKRFTAGRFWDRVPASSGHHPVSATTHHRHWSPTMKVLVILVATLVAVVVGKPSAGIVRQVATPITYIAAPVVSSQYHSQVRWKWSFFFYNKR